MTPEVEEDFGNPDNGQEANPRSWRRQRQSTSSEAFKDRIHTSSEAFKDGIHTSSGAFKDRIHTSRLTLGGVWRRL